MDNCNLTSENKAIVLRGSSGEQNNSLYISNSTATKDSDGIAVRIDNNTHKLYLGVGNNFNEDNATIKEAVIITNETY